MWYTPQAKWFGIQYALYIGSSLFGVAYYYEFGKQQGLAGVAVVAGAAGFLLADALARPIYGLISEYIGRRRTMAYGYGLGGLFQLLTLLAGLNHQPVLFAICAVIPGGLAGVNFPMTAAVIADYYGENNNCPRGARIGGRVLQVQAADTRAIRGGGCQGGRGRGAAGRGRCAGHRRPSRHRRDHHRLSETVRRIVVVTATGAVTTTMSLPPEQPR
jgi:Major Facilitator Superfamily